MASDPVQQRRQLRIQSASFRERSQLIREQQGPQYQQLLDLIGQLPADADIDREALRMQLADASDFLRTNYEILSSSFLAHSKIFELLADSSRADAAEEVEDLEEQARAFREYAEQLDHLALAAKVQRDGLRLLEHDQ